ncbi:MAG TPA: hypothetical protein VIH68_07645 [Bacteroidota bacterium]
MVAIEKVVEVFVDELARAQLRTEALEHILQKYLIEGESRKPNKAEVESEIDRHIAVNLTPRKVRLQGRL